tara:strand:- start:112 stop:372 length:261 start_codon:yes stop_codon:yes gene_type:complete
MKTKIKKYTRNKKRKINVFKLINKWLLDVTEVLKNVLVFAVVCGLLFNDPFGIISTISNLISGVGEKGLAGLISLLIITTVYNRRK